MPTKAPTISSESGALLESLGVQLRARRKALGVSVIAAAESAGMSRITWHRIEKGVPSVSAGSYASAAQSLGLSWFCEDSVAAATRLQAPVTECLPLRIRLADYPQLRRLAWSVRGAETLSPREAQSTYERNGRHLDRATLDPRERALMDALNEVFAGPSSDV